MQRKTKLKIAFYSIGFIAFALLPYVFRETPADDTQRYAPLPTFNSSDSTHPFLSRLKEMGSRLFSFSVNDSENASQTQDVISSAEALNQAAANEVLASLAPQQGTKTTTATTKTAGTAAASAAGAAPAAAEAAAEEGAKEEAQAGATGNQSLFGSKPQPYRTAGGSNSAARTLDANGNAQRYAQNRNTLPRGAKNASLMDTIASNDARLAKMNFFSPSKNGSAKHAKASSQSRGSSKSRFAKASSFLNEAAGARAEAKWNHSYGPTGGGAAITDVRHEMAMQQAELNNIWLSNVEQLAEENRNENGPESIGELESFLQKSCFKIDGDMSCQGDASDNASSNNTDNTSGNIDTNNVGVNDNVKLYPATTASFKEGIKVAAKTGKTNDNQSDNILEERQPLIIVLNYEEVKASPSSGTSPKSSSPEREIYSKLQELACDGPCFWVANDKTRYNDIENLQRPLRRNQNDLVGDPLNKMDKDGPLYRRYEEWFNNTYAPQTDISPSVVLQDTSISQAQKYWESVNYVPYTSSEMKQLMTDNGKSAQIFAGNADTGKKIGSLVNSSDNIPLPTTVLVNPLRSFNGLQEDEDIVSAIQLSTIGTLDLMDAKATADMQAADQAIVENGVGTELNNK